MPDTVISVRNLGKRYHVVSARPRYATARDALTSLAQAPVRAARRLLGTAPAEKSGAEDFWALRDVSFDIRQGEVVGIIGRNGAGKTTLLKVLSRITEPTEGSATIEGRIGSLLEVGTGFHPELSGRENIYLSAAILGMTRSEMRGLYEDIVAFAGVERFIETPIKHYSSGMHLRLAFAVAAHLKAEIMFIDEVLAVGDLEFQRRCLGRMQEVSREGRTALFVSHNMAAIEALCDKTILLEHGRLSFHGPTAEAIQRYVGTASAGTGAVDLRNHSGRPHHMRAPLLREFRLLGADGREATVVPMGSDVAFEVALDPVNGVRAPYLGIAVTAWTGQRLCTFNTAHQYPRSLNLSSAVRVRCTWRDCLLLPGRYVVELWVKEAGETLDFVRNVTSFEVMAADVHGTGKVQAQVGVFEGRATWSVLPDDPAGKP